MGKWNGIPYELHFSVRWIGQHLAVKSLKPNLSFDSDSSPFRFPVTAYENGGGAFLIPYIIVLMLIGKPIYYFEMILGQFTSSGSVRAVQAIPIMKGVGVAQQIGTTCVVTYYCSLIALTLFYMIKSFASQLPWSWCWPQWSDVECIGSSSNATSSGHGVSSSDLYYK